MFEGCGGNIPGGIGGMGGIEEATEAAKDIMLKLDESMKLEAEAEVELPALLPPRLFVVCEWW